MRILLGSLLLACCTALASACLPNPHEERTPEWQKPPTSYDPVNAEHLTFNKAGLEAFNAKLPEERDAWVEAMKTKPGSYKGQGVYKQGAELTEAMDDHQYGTYEIVVDVPDPILWEIEIDYRLYTTPEKGKDFPPHAYVEFTGNIVEMNFQADAKPRKMDLKVKVDEIKVLN